MKDNGFPLKLKLILETNEYSNIIQLINDGFIIKDLQEFKFILGKHFKHQNLKSFYRSLNKYGFQHKKSIEGYKQFTKSKFNLKNLETLKPLQVPIQPQTSKEYSIELEQLSQSIQLKQIYLNQQQLVQQAEYIWKLQNQISLHLYRPFYVQIQIFNIFNQFIIVKKLMQYKKGQNTIFNHIVCFFNNLKENQFKSFIRNQFQTQIEEEKKIKFYQNFPMFQIPKTTIIFDQSLFFNNKKKNKQMKLSDKTSKLELKSIQSLSNLSDYFDL